MESLYGDLQQWLFERVMQPVMFNAGLGNLLEDGYRAAGWLLAGVLQILIMVTLFAALQRWRPVEVMNDRRAVRVDVIYTLIHRLGLVRMTMFLSVDPLWDTLIGQLRVAGMPTFSVDGLVPGITDIGWVSFLIYLVLFDAVDYAIHRGQHRWDWWWQLHALHHSQRQMTMWSDNRTHLLDDVLRDSIFVLVALVLGIPPGQFIAVVAATQLLESLSHANVRLSFGPVLGRLLVSPGFHRQHHAIGEGHESSGPGSLGGCNFAVLFPVWDLLFGSARFDGGTAPTGIRDQLEGRDYGRGFWAQQWLGLVRLAGALRR